MAGLGANILASSIALLILLAIMGLVYVLMTRAKMSRKRQYFEKIHTELAPGHEVMFGGGIFGTVKKVDGDRVEVAVRSGAVMDVSRYAIQEISDAK